MKILQVIHDFLPNHQAGSELYCYHISQGLKQLGHDVKLLYTEIDHERSQYSAREGFYEGLPFTEIVNNHAYRNFEQTYSNPAIEKIFQQVLTDYSPDVVHFHHLLALSFGCIRLCAEKNIPVVFTLHDYWMTCPRGGGQRFRGEGKICHEVDTDLCAECISGFAFPSRTGQRLMKTILAPLERVEFPTLIPLMQRGKVKIPHPSFFALGTTHLTGELKEAIYAHPPCKISFRYRIPNDADLVFGVGMDPSTYDKPGDGVTFTVRCDGQLIYEQFLNPKKREEDRGWRSAKISLNEFGDGKHEFIFETTAHPNGRNEHCTACWIEPKIVRSAGELFRPSITNRIRTYAETILTKVQKNRLKKEVEKRRQAALKVFEEVDLFIAPSPFLREKFIEYGMPEEKIIFSDYGIAVPDYDFKPKIPSHPIRFTYVGTLVEHKGLHVIIEAFNSLPQEKAVLNVYGNINEFTGYVKRIQSMIAHPGITLRGRAENKDIPRIMAETDVLVIPSIWFENSPITIHEAFLARVPVITSRLGGMANLVQDGENGLLFSVGNAKDLHRCLKRCVDSPDLVESIRPDPKSVKTIQKDAEWMLSQYQSLIEKKR